MRFFNILASFAVLGVVISSPTTLKPIQRYRGQVNPGSYVVTLKDGVDKDALAESLGLKLTHAWDNSINGFAGKFSGESLKALRASNAVDSIAEDGIVHAWGTVTQTDAPWGLGRLISDAKIGHSDSSALNHTYEYDETAGHGVDVYVIGQFISLSIA
ncbi:hypothetical protein HGRIS_008979 [Hohenbuehelia grisea]|uniref:Inhibitor I9 domain-containing protein n=1 Tax=Hohenbuehelia grisea TaxID=104357 RepID=A0ABR3IZR5_9AGAR